MAVTPVANPSHIVLPLPEPPAPLPPPRFVGRPPPGPVAQQWAPAWFYSALNWLGKSYYDAGNARQVFGQYLVGSDVDPYAGLGATRLFVISYLRETFRLTLAVDAQSAAPLTGGQSYANTDAGIKQLYLDLAASTIFASVRFAYIPGRLGPGLNPNPDISGGRLESGYDPATGLRLTILGSAVSQVVPLDDFLKTHNEQIYDDRPAIVPIVAALVYDISQYNALGATSFVLPVYYTCDQVSPENYYVNRLAASTAIAGDSVQYGQTAVFPGGPGYVDASAAALTLESTAVVATAGETFTSYTFDTASAVTVSTLSPKVQAGVMSLTYSGISPKSVFANQRIIGFYRDKAWATCLGVPIYDYGPANGSFTAASLALNSPTLVYDPAHPFLNGGALQNVLSKLARATYLYSPDRLAAILEVAIAAKDTQSGAGLGVTTAALEFDMSSSASAPVVDDLAVPVLATVTTTPPVVKLPSPIGTRGGLLPEIAAPSAIPLERPAAAPPKPVSVTVLGPNIEQIIGSGGNTPSDAQLAPVTVQAGLTASIPREALSGTGISSLEIGTSFPEQPLGAGAAFAGATEGTALNLMDRHADKPSFPPVDIATATAGVGFTAGVYYVLSLTGQTLSVRGSDGSLASSTPVLPGTPDPNHTFVGAMIYAAATTSIRLYPKLQLTLPAPAVGTHGVLQGAAYSVRLTFGAKNSQYDIIDQTQTLVEAGISVPNPKPADGSTPRPGDVYFGSFIGGSAQMTVWSVPVFLTVSPAQLPGASFNGNMTLDAKSSGLPAYNLQITDSSLFVYSNINVDTSAIGSLSQANVYLASAVINSSPDDQSSKAFAPSKLVLGLVRQAQMGTVLKYVFVPEADSIVIGTTRYMLSVVNLGDLDDDPNTRPYPPVFWPQTRYWQFANRHNPYVDVEYTGETQAARIARAQADTARIGVEAARAQEPMHMYLDTNSAEMTVWPIFPFPYATATQSVDQGQLKAITSTILNLLATKFDVQGPAPAAGRLAAEQVLVPGFLQQRNPYTAGVTGSANAGSGSQTITAQVAAEPAISGLPATNLSPGVIANTSISGIAAHQSVEALQSQQAAAGLAVTKTLFPAIAVAQAGAAATVAAEAAARRRYETIYGFSVYNPGTGEAYIVELVATDLNIPDRLPAPTENATYDPYYVRVVFLDTLTCYNMSIIVPSMVHDQYGHLSRQGTLYQNLLSKTDELAIGYLYSLYDSANNFDSLDFAPYPAGIEIRAERAFSEGYLFTNIPYSTRQNASFNPLNLFGHLVSERNLATHFAADRAVAINRIAAIDISSIIFRPPPTPPAYFVCRRRNWSADCHLMQATHPTGKSVYLAFGGGDLVPFRLDAAFDVDKRLPAHLYKLSYTFSDQTYDAAKTVTVANTPYFVALTTRNGVPGYVNFSVNATAGSADLQIVQNQTLVFPPECYVVGQASTTLISMDAINKLLGTGFTDTGNLVAASAGQQFQVIAYNNLVYLIRAVSNVAALGVVGGLGVTSGLLIDTYVPSATGNLVLAQGARYKRSGLQFFGTTYTPTTMVDTLDTLDFTSITGATFNAPTIFIPISLLDATTGFVADLSNFLGQQVWTFVYPEIVAPPNTVIDGVTYANGVNLDGNGKPILSLQKLHFVYDPLAVLFTPNDLTHKYPLQPKQQVLALTNDQIREGICWRSANVQPQRLPPSNICAQQILSPGFGMDRPNIIYSSHNRPVATPVDPAYRGMSVNKFLSVSGVVYHIEESALSNDQTGSSLISAVSSVANMVIGVLFDYDNNDLGTLFPYDPQASTKGLVFINGYLGANGYSFSSPDHFDVNDVLPSQVPLLEQVAAIFGRDAAFYNTDVSLPRQFWSLVCDTFTAPGLPNFIADAAPAPVDPAFSNRTRSLILSLQNPVRPTELGLMDTYSSVVSANLHLQNGVTGSVFLSKKADRDVASIGSNPVGANSYPLYGLPTKYDFFLFSRDHYWTLKGATFELVDQGYAMCLVDDGSGTGTKVAKYFIDTDGNYNELYTYALYSPDGGVIESASFTLKVTLGAPANSSATPVIPETPNNANPQDLAAQINKVSNLVYAAFGPSSPGQPPAYIPIQAVGGEVQAAPISGPPGFNGYALNVVGTNRQPVQISQIYSGNLSYAIAGSTTIVPVNPRTGKPVPFYGSLSHGLDKQVPVAVLRSKDLTSFIPRPTVSPPATGIYGGNGLGALIGTQFSGAFQGSGAIPPAVTGNPSPGSVMKPDDTVFYTFNALSGTVMDSAGRPATIAGGQYFIDTTDPQNPIYGVVRLPNFTFNGNTYAVNLGTTLSDGVTSRYSLVVGGKSYLFGPDNTHVTVDRTVFTFNPIQAGAYTVGYAAVDAPAGAEAPAPIPLTQFSIAAGGGGATTDVFNNPGGLHDVVLGVTGRLYSYDPIHARVTVTAGATATNLPLFTGSTFVSNSNYGYVIGFGNGGYTVNGSAMFPYSASTSGSPASYALMTSPQMFAIGGNFYTFDQDASGDYLSVTGNGQTYPVNPYQFSINGVVYIINTNVQPNTVVGGGNIYPMSAGNTQFLLNGVQYTIALKSGSLNGATISGQFNITQGNVVVIENYVYQLDTLNGQIVGNGTTYPLTNSGFTYTITTTDRSFTVTTEPNAATVTIGGIVYLIGNTTVVGDGVIYPILAYRTFIDGATAYNIGLDGTVSVPPPFALSGSAPYTRSTFTDGVAYTVNDLAAFDGTKHYLISGSPPQFAAGPLSYTLRNDGVAITAGAGKTYIVNTSGPLSPNQFAFGSETLFFGRPNDIAAFDGRHFYAVSSGEFTDTNTGHTYTLSGNTAVSGGNSYEIFSNLGQNPYFEVPGGPTYYVNVPVADTGTPSGDIYSVFPISGGQFTIPLVYTVTAAGSTVTVAATTFAGPTVVPSLTAAAGSLTGGYFADPVTKIVYTCVVDAGKVSFIDSNNAVYPYPVQGTTDTFVAAVVVATGVGLAVDNEATPAVYAIVNNQFTVGAATYTINLPVAYHDPAAAIWPMVNGRFIVPRTAPLSNLAYTVSGGSVVKGYLISADDEFSPDGNVVYTVNAVNVVKATNQATLSGAEPNQTLAAGPLTYSLDTATSLASIAPPGLDYDAAGKTFTVSYDGLAVAYTVGAATVTDSRNPTNSFPASLAGTRLTFTDTLSGVTFTFDDSGNNPITAEFAYTNHFFVDVINGVTYYIDEADNKVEAISYLPETTQYAFVPADGNAYLIHYSDVAVVFPVVSGAHVNVGVATVGSDIFTVDVDEIVPAGGGAAIPVNRNSFEINGNLYTIAGTPAGADYSSCQVVGAAMAPRNFTSSNTFKLSDPAITYTLQLDAGNLPEAVVATFPVRPSRDLIAINDNVYLLTYNTVSTGSLLGQGQASIAIANSSFTLSNPFDATKAKFIFADLNIYDAASVVGQFTVYLAPTFFIGSATYTLDPVRLAVTDNDKRPYPLLPNPTMFSINGFNYVIDTNRVPHAIVGNNNVSPLATDVTVIGGQPIPNSTFTLNGLVYAYIEDPLHNLLTITGTKSYPIAQPGLTFKLDSSLVFTIKTTPPAAGGYPGTTAPIGTVTAQGVALNLYAGRSESGNADFFMYKNVLYTLVKSAGVYEAAQKSYTVYAAAPVSGQQQLAVFDLNGTTYMATDGTTTGVGTPAGINPGTMWAQTAPSTNETQFGLVYGFVAQPTIVSQSASGVFQFEITDSNNNVTLYDIVYTAGSNANVVKVDVPELLPTFVQTGPFTFVASYPLTFETGGYNAFTTFVAETSTPSESFSAAYKTPIVSTDSQIDKLITGAGDFSVEFWHSIPVVPVDAYHPFTYRASTATPPIVYYVDVDFEDASDVYVRINETVMHAVATPPVFSSGWRHFALAYSQPYVMLCQGAGYEVKNATNYNFSRDFSIAMTFSASDVMTEQGLLYKGTGSEIPASELSMSYRVGISGGAVTLWLTDGTSQIRRFTGPSIAAGNFYEVIIVKSTDTPTGNAGSAPYTPPVDPSELNPAMSHGANFSTANFPSSGGSSTISGIGPANPGATPTVTNFLNAIQSMKAAGQSFSVTISVRTVNADGTFGGWTSTTATQSVSADAGLTANSTGPAHLLIGAAYDDSGFAMPLGGLASAGNIRDVYLFNGAIDPDGITTPTGTVPIANASSEDLLKSGILGFWRAQYDPDGVVNNPYDQNAVAVSTNAAAASLVPLAGHEYEGTSLYLNGYPMTLTLAGTSADPIPPSMSDYVPGSPLLLFDAWIYRLQEISMWSMTRQPYQVVDDMFGRLVASNEPFLTVYLSGSFEVQAINAPILPMNKYIDNVAVTNVVASMNLSFSSASLDLQGCPAVGRCGPLITPNLYTPPGVALTVCDTVPDLTTYSVTLNTLTGTLAGEVNEAYVYIKNNVLTLYAGKKVGDLVLTWVSQEQGNVQVIGYIEGAPPCPMANMTNKPATTFLEPTTVYVGATAVTLSAPTSVTLKYQRGDDHSSSTEWTISDKFPTNKFTLKLNISPFGFGMHTDALRLDLSADSINLQTASSNGNGWNQTAASKLEETKKYTLKLQGTLSPFTGDQFMASLNTLTTPSATPGNPASKTAILPNPNLGGFTASNPPSPLPRAPTEEKFGQRMYVPSPYGEAFVTSETLDVYQQTLVQTNTVYGFVRIPDPQIPRDVNIVSFRMSSKYIRPGCLDGMIAYGYNPATLPDGAQTYGTSTGQMEPLYDGNFAPGEVGHNASYMRVVEAYRMKKQIDQEAFNALALYQAAYDTQDSPTDSSLTPALDFYNEYVWSSRGGTQEVKHTYTTSYDEVYTTTTENSSSTKFNFNVKLHAFGIGILDAKVGIKNASKDKLRYSYNASGSKSFDLTAAFDGIETDTQMRYACNNDAHFVMNFNSMFNPNNQSGLNLVIGSDGLVYKIVPSVTSGAGLPISDNIDTNQTYMQPQPSYTSGNADGLTGNVEPYDRPGKTSLFRTYAFFLQPSQQNGDDFWSTVVDPQWLANSPDLDAAAMRSAQSNPSLPWRLMYRVTYSQRFLPPVSTAATVVPQITPVIAVPVLNPATDFLFQAISLPLPRPAHNPSNDIEANIVLAAPTASGLSAGSVPTTGPSAGMPVLPNNVIPFDLVKAVASIVNWGDTANVRLLTQLVTSVLGLNTVPMSPTVLPGSTKLADIVDPAAGGILYSVYTDPNGLAVNVPTNFGITVYQDVNGNPVQYYDGKNFRSLQADYVASPDGTLMYYIQPPSTYDQSAFDLVGDYDLFGHPGDEWRYYLVSGMSANMTSEPTVANSGPFLSSSGATAYAGFTIAPSRHGRNGSNQVQGYVLLQGIMQWPNLNSNAETFADVLVYKAMSLFDTFPIGDPEVLVSFLEAQYPGAPFTGNEEINLVFAKNIVSYFNAAQQMLIPQ
ncbi:MAG TPA: hypothetical protein VM755_16790 [Stellaceae bacterium]|nr:hypothetical protein [Stellaceae bacterium]